MIRSLQKNRKTIIAAAAFIMFLFSVAFAEVYYVETSGNNNSDGSEESPWATIQKAANTATAGDTVYVKEGSYNEQVAAGNSGTPGNYIVFMAYPGDEVTINGNGKSISDWGEGIFQTNNEDYIVFSGFRLINSSGAAIFMYRSSHIIIHKNYTYNTVSSGIGAWECDNIIIDSNEVELACNDGLQECISVARNTDTFSVTYNHVHNSGPGSLGGEAIDLKDGAKNGVCHHNRVHDISRLGIYVDSWDKHTHSIHVYQNYAYDCDHDGFDVCAEKGGLLENVWIYNNIAYSNDYYGFMVGGWGEAGYDHPMKDIYVINNTFYDNVLGGIKVECPDITNIVIRNNICSHNDDGQLEIESGVPSNQLTIEYNLLYGGGPNIGTNIISGDPLLTDPANEDFSLQEGSPAIDAGSATDAPDFDYFGNARTAGSAIDVGAVEYAATGVPDFIKAREDRARSELLVCSRISAYQFEYQLDRSTDIQLGIYSVNGKRVRSLVSTRQGEGLHRVQWDGNDRSGKAVAGGVYLVRFIKGSEIFTRKVVVVE